MKKNFFITTTLPYVNADPHIGFALEIIQADVIARYYKILGREVVFNTGTDEHGLKIYRKALEEKKDPQDYVDEYAEKFDRLKQSLNLSYTNFIRTSSPNHKAAVQDFWKRCVKNGDIYKKNYKIKYCIGCELEKTESELIKGKCPIHPNIFTEIIEEENYFFKFSKYQKSLLNLYKKYPDFVLPASRLKEIKNFVQQGLQDFSISRVKEKMPWGIPVPGDDSQVMYVWFDALINYISTLGWPKNRKNFEKFWGSKSNPNALQVAGKDNLRQQSAMWQAMLLSADLPTSRQIFIHGFITVNGQKMSKSLGNIVDPFELVKKYGTDPVRYFLLREIPAAEDGDFTYEKFEQRYNADLANGLGNLVSRVVVMAENYKGSVFPKSWQVELLNIPKSSSRRVMVRTVFDMTRTKYQRALIDFKFNEALVLIWNLISFSNEYIEKEKPWELAKLETDSAKFQLVIGNLFYAINAINSMLRPFLPETAEKILKQIKDKKREPLFPRI